MIERERLEELIEQKAKIYSTHWKEEVDLSLPCKIVEYDNKTITRLVVFEDEEHAPSYMIDNLTEDIEDDAFYNYAWLNQEFSDIKQKLKDNEDAYKILCCNHQNLGKAYNELEKQLAESEEYNQMLLEEKGGYIDLVSGYSKKCKNYEQQLAEKEEMIKELSEFILEAKKSTDFLFKQDNKNLREQLAQADQDKISFAIEQLEKVKEKLISEVWDLYDTPDLLEQVCELRNAQLKFLDQQIKSIKEGK